MLERQTKHRIRSTGKTKIEIKGNKFSLMIIGRIKNVEKFTLIMKGTEEKVNERKKKEII